MNGLTFSHYIITTNEYYVFRVDEDTMTSDSYHKYTLCLLVQYRNLTGFGFHMIISERSQLIECYFAMKLLQSITLHIGTHASHFTCPQFL